MGDQPEDPKMEVKPGSMRQSHYGHCDDCGHDWVAPVIGKCPHCGSDQTSTVGDRVFRYPIA